MRLKSTFVAAVLVILSAGGPAGARWADTPSGIPFAALSLAARARGVTPVAVSAGAAAVRTPALRSAVASFYETVGGVTLSPDTLDRTLGALDALSPRYRAGLATILAAMTDAQKLRTRAFAALTGNDIRFAFQTALRAQFAPETVNAVEAMHAVSIITSIDMNAMARGAAILHAAAAHAMPMFAAEEAPSEPIETAYDAIAIGTAGSDTYTRDKQLVIEPGGDDTYLNNAGGLLNRQAFDTSGGCVSGGGTTGKAPPNASCTPLPSQVCTYDILNNAAGTGLLPDVSLPNHEKPGSGRGQDGSCGSDERRKALAEHTADINNDGDSRGVAALLDLGGRDTYSVPWTHTDPLFDLIDFCYPGDESTTNTNRDLFQGGSLSGISLLWDDGRGDNVFRGRLNAQGSGHVGGIGMLFSTGGDDDLYWADRLAQGNGIAGAIGILADTGGHNTYLLEPPVVYRNEFRPSGRECSQEGRAGQGQGGFLGVGLLWNEGDAVYRAVTHVTSAAAPYAPVLDSSGDPILVAGTDAQGSGESFPINGTPGGLVLGVGIVVDGGGSDTVCTGAGKLEGASHVTRSPGEVNVPCGRFNLEPGITTDNLESTAEHLAGGAVGIRVVTAT